MSLIPAFEIGVWNAWIFMLYHFLPLPILFIFRKDLAREVETPHSDIDKKLYPPIMVMWLLAIIYSIFLPLRLGTIWFYVGLPISIVGLIGFTIVNASWATNPMETHLITEGIYRYSRHPFYITQMVMFIGVGIATASWIFLLFSIVYSFLHFVIAIHEERYLLEKYGDAYINYIKSFSAPD